MKSDSLGIKVLFVIFVLINLVVQKEEQRNLNGNQIGGYKEGGEARQQQRANEEYQRQLKEYLKNFRNEQKAIADRFEETYNGLLEEVEEENKKNYVDKVENLASTVAEQTAQNQKLYKKFDRLRSKLRNDWMFPSL